MFPSFIPAAAKQLTESTSINLLKQLKQVTIDTVLSTDSINTVYVQAGVGNTPILLLHGFDSSLLEFRRLLPLLQSHRQVWALDLLGFGLTQRLPSLTLGAMAIKQHLYHFWQTLIQQPVILVGASMGGAAALDFTLTYPEIVEKLILLDSAGLAKQPIIGKFMFPPLDKWATDFLRNPKVRQNISRTAYYDKSFATEEARICAALHVELPNWDKSLIAFTKSGGYGSFKSRLPEIEQPTLIVWGKQDKILGTKAANQFKTGIKYSKLVWIDNCGHVPHLEQAQITAQAISNFI
ncbi:MAG: alpha/beta hydrolase [Cyanobacteria bacterium J083]|nr:MAG: alpha/beta hydrolase [Cyanobacteria bacterium J083]